MPLDLHRLAEFWALSYLHVLEVLWARPDFLQSDHNVVAGPTLELVVKVHVL